MRVINRTRGTLLADRAGEATGMWDRMKGLLGRDGLPVGEGLLITPCNSIHMFFMRFPIDALFLDAQGTVVKLFAALPPWRATRIYPRARTKRDGVVYPRRVHRVAAARRAHELEAAGGSARIAVADR